MGEMVRMEGTQLEKQTYEKPELIKHSQLKEVTLSSTGSGKKPKDD